MAQKVGVSEATVSRVLNNKPGVSEATRQAVLTALDVLGYERPTQLRGERARLVGLVLPELQNPIFPAFADVIGGALAQQGLTPVLCTQTNGGVSEADYVELLLQQQVSGVVFAGGQFAQADARHEHYRLLSERKVPVVLVNAAIEDLGFPCVACDDAVAVEQAWRHLSLLGHERIGLVLGPDDHVPSMRKLAAARAWCGQPAGRCPRTRSSGPCSRWRAAKRRRRASCGAASRASSARATRWRSARCGPRGARVCGCRTTSRWSGTTTRRS